MANDKISIDRRNSGKYRYRVWDATAKRYQSASFARTAEDEKRERPGTCAGDRWAEAMLARFCLGQATAEPASLKSLVAVYLAQLGTSRPKHRPLHPDYVADVKRCLGRLAAACPALDLNKPAAAKVALRQYVKDMRGSTIGSRGQVTRRNDELSPRTKLRHLETIKTMIGWGVGEGMIARNPIENLTVEQNGKSITPVISLDNVRAFMAINTPQCPRWLWVAIMMYTGMRKSEALKLEWSDILWKQSLIKTVGKGRKARLIPMPEQLRRMLMDLGGPEATTPRIGRVIPSLYNSTAVKANPRWEWEQFRKALREAGIEPDLGIDPVTNRQSRLKPHSCRHTYAGLMLASGYDNMLLSLAMGHAQSEMTEMYAHSATMFRAEVSAEAWAPGEMRLVPGKDAQTKVG